MSAIRYRFPEFRLASDMAPELREWLDCHGLEPMAVPRRSVVTVDSDAGTVSLNLFVFHREGQTVTRVLDNRPGQHGYRTLRVVRVLASDPVAAGLIAVDMPNEVTPSPSAGPVAQTWTAPPQRSIQEPDDAPPAVEELTSNGELEEIHTQPLAIEPSESQS